MSNRKVREAIEAKEAKEKAKMANAEKYSKYCKIESLILNYQMCKAYLHDESASIWTIVEIILKNKYNLPWQSKLISRALANVRCQKNPTISIPQFNYAETEYDILSKFVKSNFDMIVADQKRNSAYPFAFRDLMEKKS